MNRRSLMVIWLTALAALSHQALAGEAAQDELAVLKSKYEAAKVKYHATLELYDTQKKEEVEKLNAMYESQLKDLEQRFTSTNRIERALAVKRERERFLAGKDPGEDDASGKGMSAELSSLKSQYCKSLRQITDKHMEKVHKWTNDYTTYLQRLQGEFQKRGDLNSIALCKAEVYAVRYNARMGDALNGRDLIGKRFEWGVKGGRPTAIVTLAKRGYIIGPEHFESFWEVNQDGQLIFKTSDGQVSTVWGRSELIEGGYHYFEGQHQLDAPVTHALKEIDKASNTEE